MNSAAAPASERRGNQVLSVRGVNVAFPFVPYDVQHLFLDRLIEALQGGHNALLESPTGTGKTLSLLCDALGWQQAYAAAQQALASSPVGANGAAATAALVAAAGKMKSFTDYLSASNRANATLGGPIRVAGRAYTYVDGASTAASGGGGEFSSSAASMDGAPRAASLLPLGTPKIIYVSRTHSQLAQVVRELKRSGYNPVTANLGARENLCVNPKVSKLQGSQQSFACRAVTKSRSCMPKIRLDNWQQKEGGKLSHIIDETLRGSDAITSRVLDIEDLVRVVGTQKKMCPFYLARSESAQREADLFLVPYSYVVDVTIRKISLEHVDWRNSVIIFDEAHNVEEIFSEAASFDLTGEVLAGSIKELREVIELNDMAKESIKNGTAVPLDDSITFDAEQARKLAFILLELETKLNPLEEGAAARPAGDSGRQVMDGYYIFELLATWNIQHNTFKIISSLIMNICAFKTARESIAGDHSIKQHYSLDAFRMFLERVFFNTPPECVSTYSSYYKVVFHEPSDKGDSLRRGRTLSYWCFSPHAIVSELTNLGARCIIMASGTLSPLNAFASELGIPFHVRLENNHVIDTDQVFCTVLTKGATGRPLNSSFKNRDNPTYLSELGLTISNIIRVIPDGLLVFFPSYSIMNTALTFWQNDRGGAIWTSLRACKELIVEPRAAAQFPGIISAFNAAIVARRGAVLFAICRGKVSEGIDFADARGRAVIITGLPFAPVADPRVMLKRSFLDERLRLANNSLTTDPKGLSGNDWYGLGATRAVNQAAGRVIRHRRDYGAIIFLDERFAGNISSLSAWLRSSARVVDSVGGVVAGLAGFFRAASRKYPVPDSGGQELPVMPPSRRSEPAARHVQSHDYVDDYTDDCAVNKVAQSSCAASTKTSSMIPRILSTDPSPAQLPSLFSVLGKEKPLEAIKFGPSVAAFAANASAATQSTVAPPTEDVSGRGSGSTQKAPVPVVRRFGLASSVSVPAPPLQVSFTAVSAAAVDQAPPPPPNVMSQSSRYRDFEAKARSVVSDLVVKALRGALKAYTGDVTALENELKEAAAAGAPTTSRIQRHAVILDKFTASVSHLVRSLPEAHSVATELMGFVPEALRARALSSLQESLRLLTAKRARE
jgi:regulator of telomere elongation helicase 1